MKRKQQIQQFKAAKEEAGNTLLIPTTLGKSDPSLNKMTIEEVKEIHSRHKREVIKEGVVAVAKREDFEINQEESDEDFAGPSLELFLNADNQEKNQRKRKENTILQKVQDVESEEEEEVGINMLPISHEVQLAGHSKCIQTLDIDRNGNRMISGGLDYTLKIWDFPGMNRKLKPMREFKPFDGHPINSLSFDPDGAFFLCCTTNN